MLHASLQGLGHQVLQATDGDEAFSLAIGTEPDLVVLDWMMPGLSGLEVAARIRDTRDVPIIMITARDQDRDAIAASIAGATSYLRKPFSPEELASLVTVLLQQDVTTPGT